MRSKTVALVTLVLTLFGAVTAQAEPTEQPFPPGIVELAKKLGGKPMRFSDIEAAEGDIYAYVVNENNRCLDLENSRGPAILHWQCNRTPNQYWTLTKDPNVNQWEIKPHMYPTDCVDVFNSQGPDLIRFRCQLTSNQKWAYQYTQGVSRPFQSHLNRNYCLDASGTDSRALYFPCTGNKNQQWFLIG